MDDQKNPQQNPGDQRRDNPTQGNQPGQGGQGGTQNRHGQQGNWDQQQQGNREQGKPKGDQSQQRDLDADQSGKKV